MGNRLIGTQFYLTKATALDRLNFKEPQRYFRLAKAWVTVSFSDLFAVLACHLPELEGLDQLFQDGVYFPLASAFD